MVTLFTATLETLAEATWATFAEMELSVLVHDKTNYNKYSLQVAVITMPTLMQHHEYTQINVCQTYFV